MRDIKLTDKAERVFESPSFDYILTTVIMDNVNSKLESEYGDRVKVEFDRPGRFTINLKNSKGMKTLEKKVMKIMTDDYPETYQKAKEAMAFTEGVEVNEVME
jgi:hypothetical protein